MYDYVFCAFNTASPNTIVIYVQRKGKLRDVYKFLIRKPEVKRLHGRPWRNWH
jgi:hypothetical protein